MKLAIIITDITGIGGIERVTQCLANNLVRKEDCEVSIISCFKRNTNPSYPVDENIEVKYVTGDDYNLNDSLVKRLALILKCINLLRRHFVRNKYDIVITQAFLPTFLLFLTGLKTTNVICEHFKYELYSPVVIKIRNWIYKKAGKVVTLTDADGRKFHDAGIDTVTIPNMISFPIVSHVHSGKRMISVGRLHPQKGYDLLIPAMKPVFNIHPDWCLDIFGEGEERDNLQKLIDDIGLDRHITLKGYTNDIRSELLGSDICLVSSRYEGFSMAIVESLAVGLPVVSFDCPEGPGDLLKNEAGILVPPEDTARFSDAVKRMIENSSLRDSCRENGYRNVRDYTPEKVVDKWQNLFNVLKRNSR